MLQWLLVCYHNDGIVALSKLQTLGEYFSQSSATARDLCSTKIQLIEQLISLLANTYQNGGKVISCANGGLSAVSSHFVAELVGRFEVRNRPPFPALSLTSDTSILTALANDFGYDQIFNRQLHSIAQPDDVVFLMSCSGSSPNIIQALELCCSLHIKCVLVTGDFNVEYIPVSSSLIHISIPSKRCAVIQEVTLQMLHYICYRLDLLK